MRKLLIRKAARLSERVVFLSERTKSDFIHILPSEKLEAIPNPVEIPETSQATVTRERGRPRILFLGWIVRQKGVYDLVDAIPEVLQLFPEAVFTFAGNKEVERLRNLLVERGLSGASEVLGWVTGEAKVDLLQTSDVLVLPSYTEGMPNVILEAMANKIPIVTTPVGDIPSVLTNGQTALFIEAGNPQSIANGIKTLLSDPVRAAAIAEAAYACACRNHSFEIVGAQLAEVYKPVCARTGFRSFQKGRP